jgi:hypothetical protein
MFGSGKDFARELPETQFDSSGVDPSVKNDFVVILEVDPFEALFFERVFASKCGFEETSEFFCIGAGNCAGSDEIPGLNAAAIARLANEHLLKRKIQVLVIGGSQLHSLSRFIFI